MVLSKMGRLPAHILSLLVLIIIWEAAALFTASRLLAFARELQRASTFGELLDITRAEAQASSAR